jgi:MFS family permease
VGRPEEKHLSGGADTLRWNFIANTLDGALFALGLTIVSQHTVLPVLVRKIGGGNVAVGLIPVLWVLGFNLPQVLIAGAVLPKKRRKPLLLQTALVQRVPWLLLALAALLLFERMESDAALALFFLLYGMAAVGGAINLPVWFDLIAKLTPVALRGRLFGARTISGSLLGAGGGIVATFVLARFQYPGSYALLFALTFGVMVLSYLCLAVLREEGDSVPSEAVRRPWAPASLPRLFRDFPNYRNFVIADALSISGGIGAAFYAVHAFDRFSLPDSYAGGFTTVMMVSGAAGGTAFGLLADRFGHRLNLQAAALSTMVACLLAVTAPTVELYAAVFVCASLAIAVTLISRLPFLAEISPESERPTMVAGANLVASPFVLWGLAGGYIADRVGLTSVFLLAGAFAAAAFLWLTLRVKEPRSVKTAVTTGE